jgi:acyl-[acyl-carrier-protein] desaturase
MEKVSKVEVMNYLDKGIADAIPQFLKPIDEIWQPADLLPQAVNEEFFDQIKELQQKAGNLSYQ